MNKPRILWTDDEIDLLRAHIIFLEGKGYEAVKLTVIGSLLALIATLWLIPIMIPFVPKIYSFIQPYIGYILIFVIGVSMNFVLIVT